MNEYRKEGKKEERNGWRERGRDKLITAGK